MLFYLKKHILLELAVTLCLGGFAFWGIQRWDVPAPFRIEFSAVIWSVAGAGALAAWTLLVQTGYAAVRGRAYADALTFSLADQFREASAVQMVGALAAAAGEEAFFRGLIQGEWGIWAGAVTFMLAHIGGKKIRVIGYWSIFQGLGLGIIYMLSGNLLTAMLSHGLFDMGAMVYFRIITAPGRNPCAS